jgi:uncharacterized RDD family membrane protein YckC
MRTVKKPAPVMNRIGADAIDMFVISFIYGVIAALISRDFHALLNRFEASTGDYRIDFAIVFGLMALYFIVVPLVWNGFTIGKFLLRTRIAKSDGEKADASSLVFRFFLVLVPNIILLGIPAIINVYVIAVRKDKKGYHDLLAKTSVVSLY